MMAHTGDFEVHPIGTGERLKALPVSAGICAFDRDECTVTLALDSEAEVLAMLETLPSKNRVRIAA